MQITIDALENYLKERYGGWATEQGLFMKLVEEVGEIAEVLNKRSGAKAVDGEDLQTELGKELYDVIHYAVAIAAVNSLDLTKIIFDKDRAASAKYHHDTNLERFLGEMLRREQNMLAGSAVSDMLPTPFGTVRITLDGAEVPCAVRPVENARLFPDVNGAYLLQYDFEPDGAAHELCCFLDAPAVKAESESGEDLEALSFRIGVGKLTLGCESWTSPLKEADFSGAYLPNGFRLQLRARTKGRTFRFGVAWLSRCTAENDMQTWFAADLTITA